MNTPSTFHELTHRRNDGIDVTMFWDSATDQVTVAVNDVKGGDAFEIHVLPGERAMDVFTSSVRVRRGRGQEAPARRCAEAA